MYKILNKLFGFDYVIFMVGSGYRIRRVSTSPTGVRTVKYFGELLVVGENDGYPRNWKNLT